MVASTKMQTKAWKDVGTRFASLETDLRRRLDQLGADAATERRSVERALQSLVNALEQSFDGVGSAVRDAELRQDLSEIVTSVREAIAATFAGPSRRTAGTPTTSVRKTATSKMATRTTAGKTVAKKAQPTSTTRPAARKAAAKKTVARKAVAKKTAARTSTKGKASVS